MMGMTATGTPNRWLLRLKATGSLLKRIGVEVDAMRLRRAKARYRAGQPMPAKKTIVYVVGCQRSGTDMSVDLLGRSMEVDVFNEDHGAAFAKCRLRSRDTVWQLVVRSTAATIVFKPICDSHRAGELLLWHPRSKGIWVYRDFHAVASSTVVKWGDANLRHLVQLLDGGGDWGWSQWNREGYDAGALNELRPLMTESLTPREAAALYWYLRNLTFFSQQLDQCKDMKVFRYRDLVTKPHETFAKMCAFVGVAYSEQLASSVHARSLLKGTHVNLSGPIETICEQMLCRLDAEASK